MALNQNLTLNDKSENNDVIDLLPLFQTIWRKKWSIFSLVFIVMILTYLFVMTIEPTYRATATLQIKQKETNVVSIEQVYGIDAGQTEYLQTQFELLKSRTIIEKVVTKLNLTKHKEFDPEQIEPSLFDIGGAVKSTKTNFINNFPGLFPQQENIQLTEEILQKQLFDKVVSKLTEQVSISPIKKTELVKITVDMHDAKMAAKVANALGQAFIDNQLDASMEATMTATNWMNTRLSDLKAKLQDSEIKLQEFKDKEGLIDVDGIITISANELSSINEQLITARAKLAEVQSQYQQVKSISKNDWKRLASVPAVLSNTLVQQFKTDEAKAKAKIEELSKRYGLRHPSMQAAQAELTAAQASLKSQVEQVVAGIKRQYQIASANVWSLKKSVNENKQEVKNISKNEFKMRELQREVEANRALFDTFMTRLKEASATVDLNEANARIVDPAITPELPAKPKKGLIVILAGLLAGLFSVFIILLLHALNNTFKSSEEVEDKLNLPVLGILPVIKNLKGVQVAQAFHKEADRIFSECVRTIRTSVMLSSIDKPHKIVVVTSSVPSEGKSTTAINIADAIGQMENVLLIEADMRRPTISKVLNLAPGTPGLANLIAGHTTYEECIQKLYGGIDTIAAGVVPPNPLELLSSESFKSILNELSEKYDRIIIDSPPVSAVSDSLILSTLAESVIFVIKAEATDKKLVSKSIGALLQNNAPVKGVILSQVDIKKAQKQGYSYGGYYDYYGYSSSGKSAQN